MKIIFHDCIDGYVTELQFEDKRSRIFKTMQDCFEYASLFSSDVRQIPQVCIKQDAYKWEVAQTILEVREVEA